MNAGNYQTSPRLQKTLAVLKQAGDAHVTTLAIEKQTNSRAVHSDIAALRANGWIVERTSMPEIGPRVSGYRLIKYDAEKDQFRYARGAASAA
jgi:hypothetical protein